jgi:hypothetical protein
MQASGYVRHESQHLEQHAGMPYWTLKIKLEGHEDSPERVQSPDRRQELAS